MEKIPEHKATFNEKGKVVLKKRSEIKKGKLSRARGARFELKAREYWESRGWAVDKWTNNVDLVGSKLIKAKRKYNPFKKLLVVGTGFPDFIVMKHLHEEKHTVVGMEVKINGLLSKEEKQKCQWLLENNIFSQILIAKKGNKRGQIEFIDFKEKWGKNIHE